jgi:NAD(P)-dependent dehydrogenase (short-subunit alcohol dehydrogenase family)
MDLGLTGKKAIVTGGSLGIGKAIARELAREGADVAVVSRTKDVLEAAASEIAKETGRRVIAIPADVGNRAQVDGMVAQAAAQLGGLHILVNSGSPPGGSPSATGPIENLVDEDLLHDFNVKYVGALRCCRAAIPFMKEQKWGRIVNISGLNARNAGNLSGGARNTSLVHLSRPLRHHRELRAPRHHPHRAHAAPARRARQGAGRGRGRGGAPGLRAGLAQG